MNQEAKPVRSRGRPKVEFTPEMDAELLRLRGKISAWDLANRIGVADRTMYKRLHELAQPVRLQASKQSRADKQTMAMRELDRQAFMSLPEDGSEVKSDYKFRLAFLRLEERGLVVRRQAWDGRYWSLAPIRIAA